MGPATSHSYVRDCLADVLGSSVGDRVCIVRDGVVVTRLDVEVIYDSIGLIPKSRSLQSHSFFVDRRLRDARHYPEVKLYSIQKDMLG